MSMWNSLSPAHPDPMFSIAAQARAAGPEAIDATIGVYVDEEGDTKLFPSVRTAMQTILHGYVQSSSTYPPLLGIPEYRHAVTDLIFPDDQTPVASIATTGGTGALAINLRLLLLLNPKMQLCIPSPGWANYAPLCRMAGISFQEVPVLEQNTMNHHAIMEWVKKTPGPCTVLLQAGCTNPTGIDLTETQWKELIPVLQEHECAVLLDFAYQGFGDEPEKDAQPAHALRKAGILTLIAWSASKNHSLYRYRTGMALTSVPDEETHAIVETNYSMLSRGLWSAAPVFGQHVVIQTQSAQKKEWLQDIAHVRGVLEQKRSVLRENLPDSFQSPLNGRGLFAMLPLTHDQILDLRSKHNVFVLDDGRVNIAGIPERRLKEFCEKVHAVL